jgi:hypothetical protein
VDYFSLVLNLFTALAVWVTVQLALVGMAYNHDTNANTARERGDEAWAELLEARAGRLRRFAWPMGRRQRLSPTRRD